MLIWTISNFNSNPKANCLGWSSAFSHRSMGGSLPQKNSPKAPPKLWKALVNFHLNLTNLTSKPGQKPASTSIHQVCTLRSIMYITVITNCHSHDLTPSRLGITRDDHWHHPSAAPRPGLPVDQLHLHHLTFFSWGLTGVQCHSVMGFLAISNTSVSVFHSISNKQMAGKSSMKANVYLNFDFRIEKRLNIAISLHQQLYLTVEPTLVRNFTNKSFVFAFRRYEGSQKRDLFQTSIHWTSHTFSDKI